MHKNDKRKNNNGAALHIESAVSLSFCRDLPAALFCCPLHNTQHPTLAEFTGFPPSAYYSTYFSLSVLYLSHAKVLTFLFLTISHSKTPKYLHDHAISFLFNHPMLHYQNSIFWQFKSIPRSPQKILTVFIKNSMLSFA